MSSKEIQRKITAMSKRPGTSSAELVTAAGEEERLSLIGVDLINRLFVLIRNALLFDLNNEALHVPIARFLETLLQLEEYNEQQASIGVIEDNLSLNKQILKPDPSTFNNGQFLGRILEKVQAQEFQFDTSYAEEDLRAFLATLRRVVEGREDASALTNLRGFKLIPLTKVSTSGQEVEIDSRIQVLRIFAGAIAVVSRAMTLASHGLHWGPNLVRRVAYDLADAADREPNLLLGMLHLPMEQSRLGTHLVRTAVLSMLCTKKVGLKRKVWTEAALIALCHHLSRPAEETFLEEEDLVDAKGSLEAVDTDVLEQVDPLDAALSLCSRGCLNEQLIRRVVGMYEATSPTGMRGELYHDAQPTDLLGRIVFLSDRYATLLESLHADEALRLLLTEHQDNEPDLIRVFVNAVGLYPVGTMVQLESGARAIVVEAPRHNRQLLRPVVQIVGSESALIDLSQDDQGHGKIVDTLHSAELDVNISHYFLL